MTLTRAFRTRLRPKRARTLAVSVVVVAAPQTAAHGTKLSAASVDTLPPRRQHDPVTLSLASLSA